MLSKHTYLLQIVVKAYASLPRQTFRVLTLHRTFKIQ